MFDPLFGTFFWGKLLAVSGIWIHNIVTAIVAYQITGSAVVVGAASMAQFAPQVLLALVSGRMADRGNAGLQIAVGRLVTAAGSLGLAVWISVAGGVEEISNALPLLGASLVVGLGSVIGGPAMQSIVPGLIRPGEMAAAMALNSVPMTVARAAGPALGALAVVHLDAASAFAIAGACSTIFALLMLTLKLPGIRPSDDRDSSIRAALRHVRSDKTLLVLLLGIAAVGYGTDPALTLAPSMSMELGEGEQGAGWLASAFGIGAALAFLVFAPLNRWLGLVRLSTAGLLLIIFGLAGLAMSSALQVSACSIGVSGMGMSLAFTSITTQIQDRTPDQLRGRIMALWLVGFIGSRPPAAGLNGLLADHAGIDAALFVTAFVVGNATWLCWPNRLITTSTPSWRLAD